MLSLPHLPAAGASSQRRLFDGASYLDEQKSPPCGGVNSTPFVRQYDILSNRWGDLLCQEENQTNDIRRNSRKWL